VPTPTAAIPAASSAVTPVIPPGINLIVYALIASCSVGRMFAAGYLPGLLMTLSLMITVHIISKKRNYGTTRMRAASPVEIGKQALDSLWALLFPFGIVLGLRIGLFTPSEAAPPVSKLQNSTARPISSTTKTARSTSRF